MKGKNAAQLYREHRIAHGFSGSPHIWRKTALAAAAALPIGATVNWEVKANVVMADEANLGDADTVGSTVPKDLQGSKAPGAANDNNLEILFKGRAVVNKDMAKTIRRAVALCRKGPPLKMRDLAWLMSQYYGSLPGFEDLQNELPLDQKLQLQVRMDGLRSNWKDVEPLIFANDEDSGAPRAGEEAEVPVAEGQGQSKSVRTDSVEE